MPFLGQSDECQKVSPSSFHGLGSSSSSTHVFQTESIFKQNSGHTVCIIASYYVHVQYTVSSYRQQRGSERKCIAISQVTTTAMKSCDLQFTIFAHTTNHTCIMLTPDVINRQENYIFSTLLVGHSTFCILYFSFIRCIVVCNRICEYHNKNKKHTTTNITCSRKIPNTRNQNLLCRNVEIWLVSYRVIKLW